MLLTLKSSQKKPGMKVQEKQAGGNANRDNLFLQSLILWTHTSPGP